MYLFTHFQITFGTILHHYTKIWNYIFYFSLKKIQSSGNLLFPLALLWVMISSRALMLLGSRRSRFHSNHERGAGRIPEESRLVIQSNLFITHSLGRCLECPLSVNRSLCSAANHTILGVKLLFLLLITLYSWSSSNYDFDVGKKVTFKVAFSSI